MQNRLFRIIYISVNLIVPGTGLAALGYFRWAVTTQFMLLLTIAVLCWSRLVFTLDGILIGGAVIASVYLASGLSCLVLHPRESRAYPFHALLFLILSTLIFSVGFVFKDRLFGVKVFFVPSMSMYPTLKPGEFILVDTWVYKRRKPNAGEVIVFMHEKTNQWLVKRIANWPDGSLQQNDLWYLLGDNLRQSSDSRYFGGIESAAIAGRVRTILARYDGDRLSLTGLYPRALR